MNCLYSDCFTNNKHFLDGFNRLDGILWQKQVKRETDGMGSGNCVDSKGGSEGFHSSDSLMKGSHLAIADLFQYLFGKGEVLPDLVGLVGIGT